VRQYLLGAGIDTAGAAHLFRHTTATRMLDAGAGVRFLQALHTHVAIAKLREVHERTHLARLVRLPDAPPRPSTEHAGEDDDI